MSKGDVVAVGSVMQEMPSFLQGSVSARGLENATADDLSIPRLELVQSLSPCRKKSDPSYIEGASEGMLYNSLTRELYGDSVLLIPVFYRKEYIVWKNRDAGGGFRGSYPSQQAALQALAEMPDRDSCQIQVTAQHFCLLVRQDGGTEDIVLSLSRSKLKVSRKWNSFMKIATGDSFSRVYKVSSVAEKNMSGQEYYNLSVAVAGYPDEASYRKAESLYHSVASGEASVDAGGYEQLGSGFGEF